jgi:hypothetical protein
MQILNPSAISLNEAVILSSIISPRQLVRVNIDHYALLLYQHTNPIWAFKSEIFSKLLDSLSEAIVDVEIYSKIAIKDASQDISEFRLVLESGRRFAVTVSGEMYEVHQLTFGGIKDPKAASVAERWGIESVFPFDRMWFTHGFADHLDSVRGSACITDVLNRIWHDFTTQLTYCGQKTLEEQPFSSEFGDLVAVELCCGRVVFFSPENSTK